MRKPLVIVSGQIQQLQSGDNIEVAYDTLDRQNNNASPITVGMCVYADSDGGVDLAQADAAATMRAVGFVRAASIGAAASGEIMTDGILTATTGEWDTLAGTTGGLTHGEPYFLSKDTAGYITETAPTGVGEYVVEVGQALSTTELEISIRRPILL